jgi:hypothetical protein
MADAPKKKKWIKSATAGAHGQFREKAEAAGKTTKEFAAEKADAPGKLGKEARLASTLMGLHHGAAAEKLYKPKKLTRG